MTLREFFDNIFTFIGAPSLSDVEFNSINTTGLVVNVYSLALYNQLLPIIDGRELVSNTRDRLRYTFLARGVSIPESSPGKSNIFIGSPL